MNFIDRIADARDISEVFDLVNDFTSRLHSSGEIQQIPPYFRPARMLNVGDLAYWLSLISDEIKRRDAAGEESPDCLFELHAVFETAAQKVRSAWYQ
jgi:hypothetical protein